MYCHNLCSNNNFKWSFRIFTFKIPKMQQWEKLCLDVIWLFLTFSGMVGKSVCLNTYTELVRCMCKPYFCSSKKNWAKSDAYKTMCIAALPVMVKTLKWHICPKWLEYQRTPCKCLHSCYRLACIDFGIKYTIYDYIFLSQLQINLLVCVRYVCVSTKWGCVCL